MQRLIAIKTQEYALATLLVLSVLWRGGKSLDMTWILVGVAAYLTFASYLYAAKHKTQTHYTADGYVWLSLMGFVLWTVVSYLFSQTANYGLDEVLRTGSYALILLWIVRHRNQEKYIDVFLRILSFVAIAASLIGIVVYISQPVSRLVGTFFDARFHTDYWPNAWAQFVLIAWPVVLFQLLRAKRSVARLLWTFALSVLIASLFLSFSRGGMIAAAGQSVLLLLYMVFFAKSAVRWKSVLGFAVPLLLAAGVLFVAGNTLRSMNYSVESVQEKALFQSAEGTSSVSERQQFWLQAIALTQQKPLFGWGPYSFRFVQPQLQDGVLATSDHPHNVFLKFAAERGLPAMVLFSLLLAVIFLPRLRHLMTEKPNTQQIRLVLIITALLGVLAHNLIDYNLQFVGIGLPFWVLLASLVPWDLRKAEKVPKGMRSMEILCAMLLLIVALIEGTYLTTSSLGRRAEARGDANAALRWYDVSEHELFSRDMHLSRTQLLINNNESEKALTAINSYIQLNSYDARGWKLRGDLLEGDDAIAAYNQAWAYGKYNDLEITQKLVDAYLAEEMFDLLDSKKEEIDDLLLQYAEAVERNTHFIAQSANVEAYVSLANRLADRYEDTAPWYEITAAQVERHAQAEREKIQSRPPGFLW